MAAYATDFAGAITGAVAAPVAPGPTSRGSLKPTPMRSGTQSSGPGRSFLGTIRPACLSIPPAASMACVGGGDAGAPLLPVSLQGSLPLPKAAPSPPASRPASLGSSGWRHNRTGVPRCSVRPSRTGEQRRPPASAQRPWQEPDTLGLESWPPAGPHPARYPLGRLLWNSRP